MSFQNSRLPGNIRTTGNLHLLPHMNSETALRTLACGSIIAHLDVRLDNIR